MTHDTERGNDRTSDDRYQIQRQQHQKQRQQQQQQQQAHPYVALGRALPEKQDQSKHNPISESGHFASHTCDQ